MPHHPKGAPKVNGQDQEFAPGNDDLLEKKASGEEKKKGEFTRVTRLSFDEVDPA